MLLEGTSYALFLVGSYHIIIINYLDLLWRPPSPTRSSEAPYKVKYRLNIQLTDDIASSHYTKAQRRTDRRQYHANSRSLG